MPPRGAQPPVVRSESLQRQIARQIRSDIDAGILRDGDVLPSTRELAQRWGVSVFTINEAMRLLSQDGLIVSKSRSKRVVHAPDQARKGDVRLSIPHVILIGGYAGSGKTELGRILARQTGWAILDKDTLTRPVVEAALEIGGHSPHDRESDFYFNTIRPREYEALAAATIENVQCGNSAIVTAPFIREFNDPAWVGRTHAAYAAMSPPVLVTIVWISCDPGTMHLYIRRRGAARDAAKLADWAGYLEGVSVDFRPATEHVVIDNSESSVPLQDQANDLLKLLADSEPVG
jgi:DNA-binding transcriptional regulator YhcF (GntR family)